MIDVIIPHSNVDNYRTRNLFFVVRYYKEHLPGSNIILIEQNTETDIGEIGSLVDIHLKLKTEEKLFCKSFLLNEGFNLCRNEHIIFGDNDCVMNKEILAQFDGLLDTLNNKMVLPYNRHVINLTEAQTVEFIESGKAFNYEDLGLRRRAYFSNGGIVMISSENYHKLGGHDPRFVGWGGEDDAFFVKCKKTIGIERLDYDLLHLNHPRGSAYGRRNPSYPKNLSCYNEYLSGNVTEIINKIGFNHLRDGGKNCL